MRSEATAIGVGGGGGGVHRGRAHRVGVATPRIGAQVEDPRQGPAHGRRVLERHGPHRRPRPRRRVRARSGWTGGGQQPAAPGASPRPSPPGTTRRAAPAAGAPGGRRGAATKMLIGISEMKPRPRAHSALRGARARTTRPDISARKCSKTAAAGESAATCPSQASRSAADRGEAGASSRPRRAPRPASPARAARGGRSAGPRRRARPSRCGRRAPRRCAPPGSRRGSRSPDSGPDVEGRLLAVATKPVAGSARWGRSAKGTGVGLPAGGLVPGRQRQGAGPAATHRGVADQLPADGPRRVGVGHVQRQRVPSGEGAAAGPRGCGPGPARTGRPRERGISQVADIERLPTSPSKAGPTSGPRSVTSTSITSGSAARAPG